MLAARSLVIVLVLAASAQAGPSRAWTAGKPFVPADVALVAGIGAANLRSSSPLYQKVVLRMVGKTGLQPELDTIKATCGIELVAAVDSVVVTMRAADAIVIVAALKGTTRKELEACGDKLAKADHKTFAATAVGPLTRYAGIADGDLYVRWLAPDVFAIASRPDTKDAITAGTSGGPITDKPMKGALASVNTGAGVWGAARRAADLPLGLNADPKLSLIYGTVSVVKGNLDVAVHAVLDDAQAATAYADIAALKGPSSPISSLATTLAATATGNQVLITASPPVADVISQLAPLLSF